MANLRDKRTHTLWGTQQEGQFLENLECGYGFIDGRRAHFKINRLIYTGASAYMSLLPDGETPPDPNKKDIAQKPKRPVPVEAENADDNADEDGDGPF